MEKIKKPKGYAWPINGSSRNRVN
ncbi:uncharacterized protein G2W53_021507 [Senna tora]|uniref:Uncharacterized protein n=1 Tax=Senna tora TaxID=362788 RepID=A0A834TJM3_9FABA|nr:uncharacterized protein G2W53_021507 [Senna tora]